MALTQGLKNIEDSKSWASGAKTGRENLLRENLLVVLVLGVRIHLRAEPASIMNKLEACLDNLFANVLE